MINPKYCWKTNHYLFISIQMRFLPLCTKLTIFISIPFYLHRKLDLTRFNKCEILNMETITGSQLKLCLKPCDSTENTTTWCLVMGSWVHTQLNVGDIINIKAEYSNEYQSWIVDNSRGLIVFQPDILVSGTSVVGALFCMRKSILSDLFKGVDSGSSIMVLGILLHEFLQEVIFLTKYITFLP